MRARLKRNLGYIQKNPNKVYLMVDTNELLRLLNLHGIKAV